MDKRHHAELECERTSSSPSRLLHCIAAWVCNGDGDAFGGYVFLNAEQLRRFEEVAFGSAFPSPTASSSLADGPALSIQLPSNHSDDGGSAELVRCLLGDSTETTPGESAASEASQEDCERQIRNRRLFQAEMARATHGPATPLHLRGPPSSSLQAAIGIDPSTSHEVIHRACRTHVPFPHADILNAMISEPDEPVE